MAVCLIMCGANVLTGVVLSVRGEVRYTTV